MEKAAQLAKEHEMKAKAEIDRMSKMAHQFCQQYYAELERERMARQKAEDMQRLCEEVSAHQCRDANSAVDGLEAEVGTLCQDLKEEKAARKLAEGKADDLAKLAAAQRDKLMRLQRKRRLTDLAAAEQIYASEQSPTQLGFTVWPHDLALWQYALRARKKVLFKFALSKAVIFLRPTL